jgi:hypothetical protein
MTDREAMQALAAPEPEIEWDGKHSTIASVERWDAWNARRIEALTYAKQAAADLTRADRMEAALREILRRERRSEYSSIYACPTEFAQIARMGLA